MKEHTAVFGLLKYTGNKCEIPKNLMSDQCLEHIESSEFFFFFWEV